ncbi:type-F conjugative transfer system pilin assembly protein TrbC [Sphingomonas sp. SUN039]|uniref:type-F conjugative transfer system pilin assembly protein TrbC n=1 Tax=Sphingomonas sp. SUN039 TaxID=2937787 RepID=UPI002164B400|nr:type-F conjugative transfer system pilin assembly protein TrbC [Sphingomonas sp. SUN039]UVO53791.1 type-F conjugative transfer system pilin assembly protein TrbC [Sphingomonas sp. SUN039]
MNRKSTLLIGGAVGLFCTAAVLAQTGANPLAGLDVQAIQRRADATAADAQAFVDEIKRRTDAVAGDARETAATGQGNHRRYVDAAGKAPGASELDRMMADVTGKAQTGDAPQFIVFVSLSMPPESLKPLIRDVSKAGGTIVFQGFPGNSIKAFQQGIARVVDQGQEAKSIGIDPRLFRAFNVTTVPAFVVVTSDFDLCDGFDCKTATPPHDRLAGNVTVPYALESFAEGGGPGARIAATALKHLGSGG